MNKKLLKEMDSLAVSILADSRVYSNIECEEWKKARGIK